MNNNQTKETKSQSGAKTAMGSIQFDDNTITSILNMNSDSEDEAASHDDIGNNKNAKKRNNNQSSITERNESRNESDRLEIIENGIKKRRLQRKELKDYTCRMIINSSTLDFDEGMTYQLPEKQDYQSKDIQCFTSSQYSTITQDSPPPFHSNTLEFCYDAAKYCQSYYIFHLNDKCESIQLKKPPTNAGNRSSYNCASNEDFQHHILEAENYNGAHRNFLPSSIISLDQAISFYPKPRYDRNILFLYNSYNFQPYFLLEL